MLVEATRVFDLNIPAIIPIFGQRSPSRGVAPPLTFLGHPDIELQRIRGTVEELEEEQRQAY